MIFGSPLDRAVLDGRKTQTRRIVKPGRLSGTVTPCRYVLNRDYAVQRRRGGHAVARFVVTDVDRRQVGEIDEAASIAEGFASVVEFANYWMHLHDRAWPPTTRCIRCYQARNAECAACHGTGRIPKLPPNPEITNTFLNRHGDTDVWVISFQLLDQPRLLAPSGQPPPPRYLELPKADGSPFGRWSYVEADHGADIDTGYTSRERDALLDAGEAVGPAVLADFALDAAERAAGDAGRRAEFIRRRMRTLQERARELTAAGVDVGDAVDSMEQHLDLLEQQRGAA